MMRLFANIPLWTRIHEIAPVLSLTAALLMPIWLSFDPARSPVWGPEQAAVAAAVDAVPYRFGRWVGREVPLPEAAVRLLRPNATLSRQFRDLETGASVDLVVVHCGDARDMLGHYPPVCYPNSGWVYSRAVPDAAARGQAVELTLNDRNFSATMYQFSRMLNWSSEQHIRIFNFFVLPDGSLTDNIDSVSQNTSGLGSTIKGVAQVQLLTDASLPLEDAMDAASEILSGISNLFESLGVIHDE